MPATARAAADVLGRTNTGGMSWKREGWIPAFAGMTNIGKAPITMPPATTPLIVMAPDNTVTTDAMLTDAVVTDGMGN
jgi:hypothetical protein